jgi:hypothetical protein
VFDLARDAAPCCRGEAGCGNAKSNYDYEFKYSEKIVGSMLFLLMYF